MKAVNTKSSARMVSAEVTTVRVVAEDTLRRWVWRQSLQTRQSATLPRQTPGFDQAIDDVGVPVHGILHL